MFSACGIQEPNDGVVAPSETNEINQEFTTEEAEVSLNQAAQVTAPTTSTGWQRAIQN